MPTYDYRCTDCAHVFEIFHGINESPECLCEKCQHIAEKQVGAGSGIIFKGSGFYTTDYNRSSQYKEAVQKEAS